MVYTKNGPKQSGRKGVYFGHHWLDDLPLLDDQERTMPCTVAHEEIATHRFGCKCRQCSLYPEPLLWELKYAHQR